MVHAPEKAVPLYVSRMKCHRNLILGVIIGLAQLAVVRALTDGPSAGNLDEVYGIREVAGIVVQPDGKIRARCVGALSRFTSFCGGRNGLVNDN
jgi:hypothetical protein